MSKLLIVVSLKPSHDLILKKPKTITGPMCSLPEIENPIGTEVVKFLSFRLKSHSAP